MPPGKKSAKKSANKAHPPKALSNRDFLNPWNDSNLVEYFIAVRARFGSVRVLQVSSGREERDLHIDDIFVRPALSEKHVPLSAAEESGQLGEDLLDVLGSELRVVVLGDPGSGKSTLINWLAWSLACTDTNRAVNRVLGALVPFPIVLREATIPDYNDNSSHPGFSEIAEAFLSQRFASHLKSPSGRQLLNDLHQRGQLLFLFDGVDELSTAKRNWVRGAWSALAEPGTKSSSRGVLTSRIIGYDGQGLDHEIYAVIPEELLPEPNSLPPTDALEKMILRLQRNSKLLAKVKGSTRTLATLHYAAPFDDARMRDFARKWYHLRVGDPNLAEERAEEFITALSENKHLSELRHSPLLLTFMAIVHNANLRLPDGRVMLYREIVDAFLAKISLGKKLPAEFPPETVHEALTHVAWEAQRLRDRSERTKNQNDEGLLLPESEVCKIMGRVLMEKERKEPSAAYVNAFLENCKIRTGLLVPRGVPQRKKEEHYAFAHLSFQEYFAAKRILHQLRRDWIRRQAQRPGFTRVDLCSLAGKETWRETFVLLFEALSDPDSPMDPADLASQLFDPRAARSSELAKVDWLDLPKDAVIESPSQDGETLARLLLLATILADSRVDLSSDLRDTLLRGLLAHVPREDISETMRTSGIVKLLLTAPRLRGEALPALIEAAIKDNWNRLILSYCDISNVAPFTRITSLTILFLDGNPITDLSPISRLRNLRGLVLTNTSVSDLTPLFKLKNLRVVLLGNTPASMDKKQIAAFKKARPRVDIMGIPQ